MFGEGLMSFELTWDDVDCGTIYAALDDDDWECSEEN